MVVWSEIQEWVPEKEQNSAPFSSTRIKDAGIAIRHPRRRILFCTAESRNGLEGVAGGGYPFDKNIIFILLRRPRAQARACEEG